MSRLLVTTALEETWGDIASDYYLGEWCRIYGRKQIWSDKNAEIQSHHWKDRKKLRHDHDNLKVLYERVLSGLATKLNYIHGVNSSSRYWRIIVGPWLINYLPILFDKWEVLRLAFQKYDKYETYAIGGEIDIANDYNEFVEILYQSDLWNHHIFLRIINFHYKERVNYLPAWLSSINATHKTLENQKKSSLIWKFVTPFDILTSCLVKKHTKVLFYRSYFDLAQFSLINFMLHQVPTLHLNTFGKQFKANTDRELRRGTVDFAAESEFENFVALSLLQDIPVSYLESFPDIAQKAKTVRFDPKVIVTATGHWGDELFKFWLANKVTKGVKLVVVDHGGSLPPLFDIFDHDDDIADKRATWFISLQPKQVQLPPSKLVGFKIRSTPMYCSVIGLEQPRYATRACAYPIVEQTIFCLNNTLLFIKSLNTKIYGCLKVKPSKDRGWETEKRYIDALGESKVYREKNYYKVLSYSRLVVCTYSDTTFAEAMASGIPTILVHMPEFYEKVGETEKLVIALKSANIIFDDPLQAANHVNLIWDKVESWWSQPDVIEARDYFYRMTCDVKYNPKNRRRRWVSFLKNFT